MTHLERLENEVEGKEGGQKGNQNKKRQKETGNEWSRWTEYREKGEMERQVNEGKRRQELTSGEIYEADAGMTRKR